MCVQYKIEGSIFIPGESQQESSGHSWHLLEYMLWQMVMMMKQASSGSEICNI